MAEGAAFTGGANPVVLIKAHEDYTVGMTKSSPVSGSTGVNWANVADGYLYLTNGDVHATGGGLNGGKFVIKLYGANF